MNLPLTQAVKALAQALDFHAWGIAPVTSAAYAQAYQHYLNWLKEGMQAEMHYLAETAHLRSDPRSVLPEAKSLLMVLQSYFHTRRASAPIAQYAWGDDYHTHMRRRLQIIADYLTRHGYNARPFVDTAPLLEKAWAVIAGLGWIGKNTLLLNRRLGSYTFIGGVITTAELLPDSPFTEDLCGTCQRCLDACPTQALTPYRLDARRCIAYWTIEAPSMEEGMPETQGWIFGCDICQQVCPWNRFAKPQGEIAFRPKAHVFWSQEQWASLSLPQVKKLQEKSAMRRARPKKLLQIAALSVNQTYGTKRSVPVTSVRVWK
ncbi:MAG: tRNA epoxyqueuosine(34) reductase QueG [Bacteroidia bacterium]|nr:tRNA epoxyqueuosine(34) reductase QueG [Bacteroidia bacterium]